MRAVQATTHKPNNTLWGLTRPQAPAKPAAILFVRRSYIVPSIHSDSWTEPLLGRILSWQREKLHYIT